jgi:hypothetical protein
MTMRSGIKCVATAAALAASGFCSSAPAAPLPLKSAARLKGGSASAKPSSQMIDIALDADRTLRGRFVDSAGAPIDGAIVTLKQADRLIARSTTLQDGTFLVERVPAGSYRLSCGSSSGQVRCWPSGTAPPHAVVDGVTFQDNVVRGQAIAVAPALLGSSAMTTAAASGMAIGGVATYATVESRSRSDAPADAPLEPPPPAPGPSYAGQLVGRDSEGNLVRIRGNDPWNSPRDQSGPANSGIVVLPQTLSSSADHPRWPVSP